ncbi:MAG: ABC transporter permease [Blautia sp.]|nr:ABC transporter permease [Blautia sp.]
MIVSIKDCFKMIGIMIVCLCAVFVCAVFLNYQLDLTAVESQITDPAGQAFFEAQIMTGKVVCAVTGGCLLLTSVVLLAFYIRQYIDTHRKEIGILKAIGYPEGKIAAGFGVFGVSVLCGTLPGYGLAHCMMPLVYRTQNKEGYLPDVPVHFHMGLMLLLVLLPSLLFAVLAVFYSCLRLRIPVLELLFGKAAGRVRPGRERGELSFLAELKRSNVRQRKSLVFFLTFASFCFSAMVQMSASMRELASVLMGVMMFSIGMLLAVVTLLLALSSVRRANEKTLTMMKVFGYSRRECCGAVLGGYRPWTYFGFALGTVYQYVLLRLMVTIVFKDVEEMPEYAFDWGVFILTLAVFLLLYELIMYVYGRLMDHLSLKEIMAE